MYKENNKVKTEYELRVLEIEPKSIISLLEELGANKIGNFEQKRYVYNLNPAQDGKWIRLRTNGRKTTLTYKDIVSNTIDGTKEIREANCSTLLKEYDLMSKELENAKKVRNDFSASSC